MKKKFSVLLYFFVIFNDNFFYCDLRNLNVSGLIAISFDFTK